MKRREAMDDKPWAKYVFRRRVSTAVSMAKARPRKSVGLAQLSAEKQDLALLREMERVHFKQYDYILKLLLSPADKDTVP